MKWVLLITAPDQLTAEMWKVLLVNNGVSAILRPQDTSSFLGVTSQPCALLVAEERVDEARAILEDPGVEEA